MKRVVPPNMFKPFRCVNFSAKNPSEEAINIAFNIILEDMATSDEMLEEMMNLDTKGKLEFVRKQQEKYNQQPSPDCFYKYITMDNYRFLSIDSLELLHYMLEQGSISWAVEFVHKYKGHMILINKLLSYRLENKFSILHQKEFELKFIGLIFQCIRDFENINKCLEEFLKEQKLLPTFFEALSIQNGEILKFVLEDLIPFILYTGSEDIIFDYIEKNNLYSIISGILKNQSNLPVVKSIINFLNALYIRFDQISHKVNFVLKLQNYSIITQLNSIKIPETERIYKTRQIFIEKIDNILDPLNQIFPKLKNLNPFNGNDVNSCVAELIGSKNVLNMNLSLIDIESMEKQEFDKINVFLHNFLTLYRHYKSHNINISIKEIANNAFQMKGFYNPVKNDTFTEDFYELLYKNTSFIPSDVLKNIDVPNNLSSISTENEETEENNTEIIDLKQKNEKLTQECNQKDITINALNEVVRSFQNSLSPEHTTENENITIDQLTSNNDQKENSLKQVLKSLQDQILTLQSQMAKVTQERDELQKIIDKDKNPI